MLRGSEYSFRALLKSNTQEGGRSMLRIKLMVFVGLAAALALPQVARAQATPLSDVFWLDYFDNAGGTPDASVRITNPGTTFTTTTSPSGDLCALIYVYRPDQELSECCGCKITPNGLLKLSVNNNLTSNPANGKTLTSGVIKIISALPSTNSTTTPTGSDAGCDAGGSSLVALTPTPALRAWATHLEDNGTLSESPFQAASLSVTELELNQLGCIFIEGKSIIPGIGSGAGLCSCTNEASGNW
jgi:hypothetical protein